MSVHFISGKPGGGKSLYAVKLIIEELLHGNRTVITNVPLILGKLNEYLQHNYPNHNIDLHTRVRLLSDEEAGKFWTIRPEGSKGAAVLSKEQWQQGERPDYAGVTDGGVLYAIDEVHNYFNARHWMETGRDVLFYLSQHRKLGDTVVCITQHIGNVDKQFRSVAQDYTYLRNMRKQKVGMFKLPGIFVRRTYPEPATPTSVASETGTFRLDVSGIASCYDTAQGVSIHGRHADKREENKGIHWLVPVVGVPLVLFAIYHYGPKAITGFFSKAKAQTQTVAQSTVVPPMAVAKSNSYHVVTAPPLEQPKTNSIPVYCTGITRLKNRWMVWLSDGRMYEEGDLGLEQISKHGVQVEGKFYANHPPLVGESSFRGIAMPEWMPVRDNLNTYVVVTNLPR